MATIFQDMVLDGFDFTGACSKYEFNGECGVLELLPADRPGSWRCENPYGVWEMEITRCNALSFQISSRLYPAQEVKNVTMHQLVLPEIKCGHLLFSGMKMGSCGTFKLPVAEPVTFQSYYTCALTRGDKTLLITHPLEQSQFASVSGTAENERIINLSISGNAEFYSGKCVEFPPVTLSCGNGLELLEKYADTEAAAQCRKDFSTPPANGWNTWDFYRWTITEKEVLKNAEFIARDPILKTHIRRIIIDDGWQYCYGEWEANCFFPGGMEYLAGEIKKMAFTPGLWIAPAIIEPHCRIAQLEYDMLAQSIGGQPTLAFDCMRRKAFVLDPTVAKSRRWLQELFDKFCNWGYEYFKLDFLAAVTAVPRFADQSVPHSQIMQRLMEPVAAGVAGRAEILGCNYPFSTGNRFVTNVRTGSDIHSKWSGIKANARNSACRYWTNKKLWINDPDFALCRGIDTTNHPETLKPCLVFVEPQDEYKAVGDNTFCSTTLAEQQVLLSIVIMTGGAVNLSDDLTLLNEAGLELAHKVVSAESGMPAVPLDLFQSDYPAVWLQKLANGGRLLIVNWEDQTQHRILDKSLLAQLPGKATDFWSGKERAVPAEVTLAPHHCLLLQW